MLQCIVSCCYLLSSSGEDRLSGIELKRKRRVCLLVYNNDVYVFHNTTLTLVEFSPIYTFHCLIHNRRISSHSMLLQLYHFSRTYTHSLHKLNICSLNFVLCLFMLAQACFSSFPLIVIIWRCCCAGSVSILYYSRIVRGQSSWKEFVGITGTFYQIVIISG